MKYGVISTLFQPKRSLSYGSGRLGRVSPLALAILRLLRGQSTLHSSLDIDWIVESTFWMGHWWWTTEWGEIDQRFRLVTSFSLQTDAYAIGSPTSHAMTYLQCHLRVVMGIFHLLFTCWFIFARNLEWTFTVASQYGLQLSNYDIPGSLAAPVMIEGDCEPAITRFADYIEYVRGEREGKLRYLKDWHFQERYDFGRIFVV